MKKSIKPLKGKNISLRLLEENDLGLTLTWRNKNHIRKWFINSEKLTLEQHQNFYRNYLTKDNDYIFIIDHIENNKYNPIGQLSLYNIDYSTRVAEFGRIIIGDDQARGKGFASTALELILIIAKNEFNLSRIKLEVFHNNIPAISLYKNHGFHMLNERRTGDGKLLLEMEYVLNNIKNYD